MTRTCRLLRKSQTPHRKSELGDKACTSNHKSVHGRRVASCGVLPESCPKISTARPILCCFVCPTVSHECCLGNALPKWQTHRHIIFQLQCRCQPSVSEFLDRTEQECQCISRRLAWTANGQVRITGSCPSPPRTARFHCHYL